MDVVFPRAADAAEHLDGGRADARERVGPERVGEGRGAVRFIR